MSPHKLCLQSSLQKCDIRNQRVRLPTGHRNKMPSEPSILLQKSVVRGWIRSSDRARGTFSVWDYCASGPKRASIFA